MLCLPWPRLRRPSILGARPMIAGCLLVTVSVIITLHAGICVGGMWRCSPDKAEPKGPSAIVQLRRDVAATLMKVAADVRSGNTATVAAELEATAALLDYRYFRKLKGPPPPKKGFAPSALGSSSPQSGVLHILGEEQEEMGYIIKKPPRDLLNDKMKGLINNKQGILHKNFTDASVQLTQSYRMLTSENKLKNEPKGDTVPLTFIAKEISLQEREKYEVNEMLHEQIEEQKTSQYMDYASSAKPDQSQDFMNILTGEAELDDLGDEPLPPVLSQVTVMVDGCGSSPAYVVSVVRQAAATWPGINIIVGVDDEKRAEVDDISHHAGVTVLIIPCEKWRRSDISLMLEYVTTPFTLLLDGISAVTDDLNLVRLLSVVIGLRSIGVGVVGGAERGRDGYWDYKCTSMKLKNSRLTLRDGYDYSRAACLFCDLTSLSFLAATKVLREVPYDLNLPYRSQMLDWGLRLQRRGILSMTCPDVMFHSQRSLKPREQHREPERSCLTKEDRKQARAQVWAVKRQYRKLAQKWEVNYVNFNNGTSFEYNCREIRYECNAYYKVRYYLLPPCCLKMKYKMFNTVDIIAKENHIPYEISSGTLLGALKFKDGLPWDFDDDAQYRNSDVEIFLRNKNRMRRLGLSPSFTDQANKANKSIISKYIYATSPGGFFMDLWGVNKLSSTGSIETLAKYPDNLVCLQYGHIPTPIKVAKSMQLNNTKSIKSSKPIQPSCFLSSVMRVGSNWLPGPWNPGKKALIHYGDNLFHHQGHWRWSSIENPGWLACPKPGHHSCLDTHPMDGSLPFL